MLISNMERHYQHTSPFPPEFRTTHNFFTKEVFVMPLHPAFLRVEGALVLEDVDNVPRLLTVPEQFRFIQLLGENLAPVRGHNHRVLRLRDDS